VGFRQAIRLSPVDVSTHYFPLKEQIEGTMKILATARCRVLLSLGVMLAAGGVSPACAQKAEASASATEGAAVESTADDVVPEIPAAAADVPTETPVVKRTDKQALRRDLAKNHEGHVSSAVHRMSEEERAALHRDLRSAIRTANDNDETQPGSPPRTSTSR
jgi:hypothetical protein